VDEERPSNLTAEEIEERLAGAGAVEITLTFGTPFGRYEEAWELMPDWSWRLAESGTYKG
jgi:hypothetical protein